MNFREIEGLKFTLSNLARQGCSIRIPAYGIEGRVIGVGFKPYWTNPIDSKIDKVEFNILDSFGRVVPFSFNYITGCDILQKDKTRVEESKKISLNFHVYSPGKAREEEPSDKIQVDLISQ